MTERRPTHRPSRTARPSGRSASHARPSTTKRGHSHSTPTSRNLRASYAAMSEKERLTASKSLKSDPIVFAPSASAPTGSARPSVAAGSRLDEEIRLPMTEDQPVVISRRQLLYGALGVGALAAVGAGVGAVQNAAESGAGVATLEVPEDNVFSLENCETLESDLPIRLEREVYLPYGSLVWASSDAWAACLLPTETASPLAQGCVINLDNGNQTVVLPQAVSEERGFDVCDLRCNEHGIVWTEVNCFSNLWRVFQATLENAEMGDPHLMEEGDSAQFDVPYLAVAGRRAYWQVQPNLNGDNTAAASVLKSVKFGATEPRRDWVSNGRFCTAPYSTRDGVCIAPRKDVSGVYYQITALTSATAEVVDTLTLPASMRPLCAAYFAGRFSFAFENIYNYGGGIANLGTYAPADAHGKSGATWFRFDRSPVTAPAWAGDCLVVKSTRSVSGVHLADRTIFALDVPDDCDSYGDYLASEGEGKRVVTYLGVSTVGSNKYTLCRIWYVPAAIVDTYEHPQNMQQEAEKLSRDLDDAAEQQRKEAEEKAKAAEEARKKAEEEAKAKAKAEAGVDAETAETADDNESPDDEE